MALAVDQLPHTIALHESIKLDPARWAALEYRGTTQIEADETGPAVTLEFRNCSCHSTLAVELATVIRESATQTLLTSLEREGLTIDPAVFARLMRELGNNVAQAVCGMEVQS